MPTQTRWTIDTTGDRLTTDDELPLGRLRDRIRSDAARWARQGLTFEGVSVDRMTGSAETFVVKGQGYELRTISRDGFRPVDALMRVAEDDWTEIEF